MDEKAAMSIFTGSGELCALTEYNAVTSRFGLWLTEEDVAVIAAQREKTLRETGRVELSGGIMKRLVYTFCDSPYIEREDWAQTLLALNECFHYIKSECGDTVSDDELIGCMKELFDGECEGSVEQLSGACTEELLRCIKGLSDED